MPSPRKRIGFLPSEEVHEIIEKLCTANKFSQSKITGLLVEEALRSRGVLNESYGQNQNDIGDFINFSFDHDIFFENNKSPLKEDDYVVNKKILLFRFITFLKYLNSINSCIILISSDNTFLLTV